MGRHYSQSGSYNEHKKLSEDLGKFAKQVRQHFENEEKTHGILIYAGGEDFLGFTPIGEAFSTLRTLRQFFIKTMDGCTFSAGIAFAHYKEPLGEVLQCCRHMEYIAKRSGRNAFAVAAMKHSGSVESAACPFVKDEDDYLLQLNVLLQAMLSKNVSTNFVYNLLYEFMLLLSENNKGFGNDFSSMLKQEAGRWLRQSLSDKLNENDKKGQYIQLSYAVERLILELPGLDTFFLLRILAFLVREGVTSL